MGVHVGKLTGNAESGVVTSQATEPEGIEPVERLFPPQPKESAAQAVETDATLMQKPALKLVACPLGEKGEQIGMYNPQALAGRALSLTSALSPDYMQSYLSGLEDLMALKRLPEPTRRRR